MQRYIIPRRKWPNQNVTSIFFGNNGFYFKLNSGTTDIWRIIQLPDKSYKALKIKGSSGAFTFFNGETKFNPVILNKGGERDIFFNTISRSQYSNLFRKSPNIYMREFVTNKQVWKAPLKSLMF